MQRRHFKITDLEKEQDTMAGKRGEADLERTEWNFLSRVWLGFPDGEKTKNGGKAIMEQTEAANFPEFRKSMNLWNQEAKWVLHKQKDHGKIAEIKHKEVFF